MEITEVRIKLINNTEDRLRGFCSITFDDCFVVRDLKIIEGNNGPFVAMPSRKMTSNCYKCRTKNHLRANYCNNCGSRLKPEHIEQDQMGRAKLYADIAHPVNARCREMIQNRVIDELNQELDRASQPGYRSRYEEHFLEDTIAQPHKEQERDSHQTDDNPVSPRSQDDTSEHRQDGKAEKPAPHSPSHDGNPKISSERSKPEAEDFGKGIFD